MDDKLLRRLHLCVVVRIVLVEQLLRLLIAGTAPFVNELCSRSEIWGNLE